MRTVFIIVDCSGSIAADDPANIAKLNDLIREIINELRSCSVKIITYADNAELYWQSESGVFTDIPESAFGGRSNLGSAYNMILTDYTDIVADSVLALISDGEATDNYKKYLDRLNRMRVTARTALSTGNSTYATDNHAANFGLAYKFDKNRDFIEKIAELAE